MAETIREVAKRAGVSISTVSRVINNSSKVKEGTRQRVLQVIKELGYVPNALARGLTLQKTHTIGLILPEISSSFFSEVIRGVDNTAINNGFHLLVSSSHSHRSDIELIFNLMRGGRVDGLILMVPTLTDDAIQEFYRSNFPLVILFRQVKDSNIDNIVIDNFHGAYQVVTHLIKHGHRRIAAITGPSENFDASERLRGYKATLKDHNIEITSDFVISGDFRRERGFNAMHTLLDLPEPPTAVFAANDSMAIGAMEAMEKRGFNIPNDIAVAGFDDIELASFVQPPLTTVRLPMYELGVLAVERIIKAINDEDFKKDSIVLATELVVRKSCGCE